MAAIMSRGEAQGAPQRLKPYQAGRIIGHRQAFVTVQHGSLTNYHLLPTTYLHRLIGSRDTAASMSEASGDGEVGRPPSS